MIVWLTAKCPDHAAHIAKAERLDEYEGWAERPAARGASEDNPSAQKIMKKERPQLPELGEAAEPVN